MPLFKCLVCVCDSFDEGTHRLLGLFFILLSSPFSLPHFLCASLLFLSLSTHLILCVFKSLSVSVSISVCLSLFSISTSVSIRRSLMLSFGRLSVSLCLCNSLFRPSFFVSLSPSLPSFLSLSPFVPSLSTLCLCHCLSPLYISLPISLHLFSLLSIYVSLLGAGASIPLR